MKHSNSRHSMRRNRRSMWSRQRSMRRRRRSMETSALDGDVGARRGDVAAPRCVTELTPQMCNRVTNHGDTSTFSKPGASVLWCFTKCYECHDILIVVSLCLTMFHKCFMMFYDCFSMFNSVLHCLVSCTTIGIAVLETTNRSISHRATANSCRDLQ